MDYQNPRKTLTREQKTGFVLLLVFGILAIGLGVLQMRNNIFNPFAIRVTKQDMETTRLFMDENAKLQSIDTDQDGLNDYEELSFYETSPYLPDTDSDGIKDKQEIEKGTDPNCPEGEECSSAEVLTITSSTMQLLDASSTLAADFLSNSSGGGTGDLSKEIKILSENPSKIREMVLLSGAVTKEQLSNIDDATLLQLFKDALVEKGGAEYLNNSSGVSTTSKSFDSLANTSTKKVSR